MPILESLKQFLKPDWRKIVFIAIFFFLATSLSGEFNKKVDNSFLSGPLGFMINNKGLYKEWGFPFKWLKIGGGEKITSYKLSLAADLIFWYLISCFFVFAYDKFKNKK